MVFQFLYLGKVRFRTRRPTQRNRWEQGWAVPPNRKPVETQIDRCVCPMMTSTAFSDKSIDFEGAIKMILQSTVVEA